MSITSMQTQHKNNEMNRDQNGTSSSSITTSTTPTPTNTTSPPRLSELSAQLRKLQSTNQSQSTEIERLERKLRILSDLKGVSVRDLRSALESACQNEAHSELRDLVASLRSQLAAATAVASRRQESAAAAAKADESAKDAFDAACAARITANWELRVGELEELEGKLRGDIRQLYASLEAEKAKTVALETTCARQTAQMNQMVMDGKNKQKKDAAEQQQQQQLYLRDVAQAEVDVNYIQAREATIALQGEREKISLLKKHLSSLESAWHLRRDQYESRIMMKEGNIADLEQQISSLYAAFGIVQSDRKSECERSAEIEKNLTSLDFEIAKKREEEEKKAVDEEVRQRRERVMSAPTVVVPPPVAMSSEASVDTIDEIWSPRESPQQQQQMPQQKQQQQQQQQQQLQQRQRSKSQSSSSTAKLGSSLRKMLTIPKTPTSSPSQSPMDFPIPPTDQLVYGYLTIFSHHQKNGHPSHSSSKLFSSTRSPKGGRVLYCSLHGNDGHYIFRYGDNNDKKTCGCVYISSLHSVVRQTWLHAGMGFELCENPEDKMGGVLHAAAANEADLGMWMAALLAVTAAG